ncbi:hypothetical protein [Coxiella endosymbiont of Ornithodoros amblus]|uniref:hypothetical protein n=1 Tax=Coxiella endosymbiont of Ornithodoros amblus TaxID=1656166 RepID=UPI00244E5A2B|nr:hypothetical protein [Coxiella endosymbiont of Ornithodoros amblus]
MIIFTFLALMTRWLHTYFYSHPQVYIDESAKMAFFYIWLPYFTVSLLFALVVAGALSVGIVFELQNIVATLYQS